MNAQEYAEDNAMSVEVVIKMIKSGELVGHFEYDTWVVGKKYPDAASSGTVEPIYKNGMGEGLLDFLGVIFLFFGIVGGLFVFSQWGGSIAFVVFVQGVAAFAIFKGMASIIKLLKFVSEKLDR